MIEKTRLFILNSVKTLDTCKLNLILVQLRFDGKSQESTDALCLLLNLPYAPYLRVRDSNDRLMPLQTDLHGDPANGQATRYRSGRAPAKTLGLRVGKQNGFVTAHFQDCLDNVADQRFVIHDIEHRSFLAGRRVAFCFQLAHPVEWTFIFNRRSVN